MSAQDKYSAYLYWSAKNGIKTLSFNAWINVNKKGVLYV